MKLMIVDDHPATRKLIRQLLDGPGVTFCECASGDEAMLRAHDFHPDWVTMDIHMPGLNGLKATSEIIKQSPRSRILIVSADNESYLRGMAHLAGATGYLCKENLIELRTLITKTETNTEVATSPPDRPTDASPPCHL